MHITSKTSSRQAFIDLLRGFALLGILVVNIGHFSSTYTASGTVNPMMDNDFERLIVFLVSVFFDSKFYILFCFLFGYSFYLQSQSQLKKAYFRRLGVILLLGILHALLLTRGDILIMYAVAGALLWSVRHASTQDAFKLSMSLIIIPNLCLYLFGYFAIQQFDQQASFIEQSFVEVLRNESIWLESMLKMDWPQIIYVHYFELSQNGLGNLLMFGSIALAMMILGQCAARAQLFLKYSSYSQYFKKITLLAALLALPIAIFTSYVINFSSNFAYILSGMLLTTYTAIFLTAFYVVVLWQLWEKQAQRPWMLGLIAMGRMSLSNYILQSVICTYLFFGVGMGWIGELKPSLVLLIAVLILLLQCGLSLLWLSHFRYGPLEWLLRCVTHLKVMPMRHK